MNPHRWRFTRATLALKRTRNTGTWTFFVHFHPPFRETRYRTTALPGTVARKSTRGDTSELWSQAQDSILASRSGLAKLRCQGHRCPGSGTTLPLAGAWMISTWPVRDVGTLAPFPPDLPLCLSCPSSSSRPGFSFSLEYITAFILSIQGICAAVIPRDKIHSFGFARSHSFL